MRSVLNRVYMQLFDWTHHIDLKEEVQEIYLHRFLFKLALATVTIFLPLYLYELGYTIPGILKFFMVYYGLFIVLSWPAAHVAARIGYKHTSFISSPFILGFYLVLRSLDTVSPMVYAAAILGGIGFITYWIGMNSEMARSSHGDRREEETGYFFSMPLIASIISPFLGGLIIATYGFSVLFLFAVLLIMLSYTPFLLSREHSSGMDVSPGAIFNRDHFTDFFVFAARGANGMGKKVLWPLYLAVVVTGALNIGGAGSIMAFGGAIVSVFTGKHVTPDNRGRVLLTGAVLMAASWVVMVFVTTPLQAFAISFANGLVYNITALPLYTEVLEHAEHEDIIEYFAFREIGLCTGRVIILTVFLAVFTVVGTRPFLVSFLCVTAAALGMGILGNRLTKKS